MKDWQIYIISYYLIILLFFFFLYCIYVILNVYLFKFPRTIYRGFLLFFIQILLNINIILIILLFVYFYENEMYDYIWYYFLFTWWNYMFINKIYSWLIKIDKDNWEENFTITSKILYKFTIFLIIYMYICIFDIELDWENKLELFLSFYTFIFFIDVLIVYNIFSTNSTVYRRIILIILYSITLFNTWLIIDYIWGEVYEHYIWERLYLYFLFVLFNILFQWFLIWNIARPGHIPYTKIHKFIVYNILILFQWIYFFYFRILIYINRLCFIILLIIFILIFDLDIKLYVFIIPYINVFKYIIYFFGYLFTCLISAKFFYHNAYVKSQREDKKGYIFFNVLLLMMCFYVYIFYNYGNFFLNLTLVDIGSYMDYLEYLLIELYKFSIICWKYFIWFLTKVLEFLQILYELIVKGKY